MCFFFGAKIFPEIFSGGCFETLVIVEGCCWLVRAKKLVDNGEKKNYRYPPDLVK